MLKILHTADIHLGAKFSGLGDKGASQREQLRATFKNVITTAISEGVNIVLIAGDLFDANQQPQKNINLVIEQFNLLGSNNIPVCLIPGTHDSLDSSSIYKKENFEEKCPNLEIFADENTSYKEYPGLDLTVYVDEIELVVLCTHWEKADEGDEQVERSMILSRADWNIKTERMNKEKLGDVDMELSVDTVDIDFRDKSILITFWS